MRSNIEEIFARTNPEIQNLISNADCLSSSSSPMIAISIPELGNCNSFPNSILNTPNTITKASCIWAIFET